MNKIIILDVSHLDWQPQRNFDPHEFDPADVYHPCMKWCDEQGMHVDWRLNAEFVENEEGIEELIWSEPEVFGNFYSEADAVMFKLRWSDRCES